MRIVETFPRRVREIEHAWIPMTDGRRLAARLWLPDDATEAPVPAILEYLPYRRRDGTRVRDDQTHPFYAGHGYACVRVDMRGTGDSDGVLHDEYLPQEQADGLEVLRWIAAQPWCSGAVGMIGISWGGFNGLQIAAHAPEELKAIVTICSTDDRYADDIHYMGGCLLSDNFAWANTMFPRNAKPPDPVTYGEGWRDAWLERLEANRFWLEPWLEHQRRDAYWAHASVCEDFAAIRCPVFAVGGWADGYSNAVPRLLAGLQVPRLGLVGPWAHRYPHLGVPGPAIDFLGETLRWWDHWLKGRDTGIMDEPQLRAWMQDSAAPATHHEERPGRWVGEPSWPSERVREERRPLAPGRLGATDERVEPAILRVRSPLGGGLDAGDWCSYGNPGDQPGDQRRTDGGALVFDSDPLEAPLELLGAPVVDLEVRSDEPQAQVAVRLSDVRPDGTVTRIGYGLLNLSHRDSHADPTPLEPGRSYRVSVRLNDLAQRMLAGHRLRLAITTDYWPVAWPSPRPATLEVTAAASQLRLPVRAPRPDDDGIRLPTPARGAPPTPRTVRVPPMRHRRLEVDQLSGETALQVEADGGTVRFDDIDLTVTTHNRTRYTHRGDDPTSARVEAWDEVRLHRDGWEARIRTHTSLHADSDHFHTHARLEAFEGERRVFDRTSERSVPRDHV
jgi:uncharacterized protein